ncbi:MAG: secondary thiamine-phosphate synthase enzyme YjbQ [Proteobacteria bacterium]|nr:secondary thiamine-phosphate synthase enzyme YjbQ [Pseudomonadota bacterium]MBU1595388.1 secondary thiamine-phosphate synthase enzyme YjbQ [Pseudomonadota bacterium]
MRQFSVSTTRREEFLDITAEVAAILRDIERESGPAEGAVLVYSPHTTAGITINEGADPDVRRDMLAHLAKLVPCDPGFRHAEGNSDAHIKTSLMGPSQLVPVTGGRLKLGTWQKIYCCEFDGPRRRTVLVQFLPSGSGAGEGG